MTPGLRDPAGYHTATGAGTPLTSSGIWDQTEAVRNTDNHPNISPEFVGEMLLRYDLVNLFPGSWTGELPRWYHILPGCLTLHYRLQQTSDIPSKHSHRALTGSGKTEQAGGDLSGTFRVM